MSNNAEINSILKRREQYQKLYDEAVNTDLSFANEEKRYEVERTKTMYAQRIAKIDKELEALNYKEESEEVQFEVSHPPLMTTQPSHVEMVQPGMETLDNRTAEEILTSISGPKFNNESSVVRGQDIVICLNCNTFNKITNRYCTKCELQIMKEIVSLGDSYVNITENNKIKNSLSSIMVHLIVPFQDNVLDVFSGLTATKGIIPFAFVNNPRATAYSDIGGGSYFPAILVATDNGVCIARTILGCYSCLILYRLWRDINPIQSSQRLVYFLVDEFYYTLAPIKKEKKIFYLRPGDTRHDKDNVNMNRAFMTRYRPIQIVKKREWLTEIENNPDFSEQLEDLRQSIYKMEKQHKKWMRKKKDIILDKNPLF